jgi:hypothetical protein
MDNLYVRNGIQLSYYSDKGVGGQIPAGTIKLKNDAVFRTKDFYTTTLNWDFDNIWTISEGEYPTFKSSDADRITPIRVTNRSTSGIFDLQGRFLNTISYPGVYIADGKKINIK